MVRGVLALALGLAALFWPSATLSLLVRLIGIYVLFDGVVNLLAVFRAGAPGAYVTPGLLGMAVGLILLFWPGVTGRLLMVVVGFWALFQGGSLIVAARRRPPGDPDRGPALVSGALAGAAGLILVVWPGAGVVTLSWVTAIAALSIGALLVTFANRLRRADRRTAF